MTRDQSDGWRWPFFIACNAVALALVASWYLPGFREAWVPLDIAVFQVLNGSLADGRAWQIFWAVANTRSFDAAAALVILALYSVHLFGSGSRVGLVRRFAQGMVILFTVLVAVQVSKTFLGYGRYSPSLSVEGAIRLTEIVSSFEFKDFSRDCFPGDHGISLIVFTALLWHYVGRRFGLLMLGLSLFLLLPRLVVGAHWLTDHVVGGAYVSLFALGWMLGTPLHAWLARHFERWVDWGFGMAERMLAPLAGGEAGVGKALSEAPITAAKGMCMGSADIVPGVSGGTMALILGIYERLLRAIRSVDKDWFGLVLRGRFVAALSRNDLLFLVPLGLGILAALLFFTHAVPLPKLIVSHPEQVYGLFFGLILASVFILMGAVERYGVGEVTMTLLGVAAGFTIVNLVPVETPDSAWFIFLCGFVAISAMLLPGISGSFILLILGKYAYIIDALGHFDMAVIGVFMAGMASGLVVFSRVIVWLLSRYHQPTLLVIKGILIGSLWIIWPFQERVYETVRGKDRLVGSSPVLPEAFDGTALAAFAWMVLGIAAVLLLNRLASRGGQGLKL